MLTNADLVRNWNKEASLTELERSIQKVSLLDVVTAVTQIKDCALDATSNKDTKSVDALIKLLRTTKSKYSIQILMGK